MSVWLASFSKILLKVSFFLLIIGRGSCNNEGQAEIKLPKYELDQSSSVVYTCDYNSPQTSLDFSSSGMPCSGLYTNSTALNRYALTFDAQLIESIKLVKIAKARRCFRLKLMTKCTQHWFIPNEITRSTSTETVSRSDCYSDSACIGCEISSHYPQENCEVFTFGKSEVSVIKTFVTEVDVYQDVLGQTTYKSLNTFDDYLYLGGDYKEKVFFTSPPPAKPRNMTFTINPSSYSLISYELRRIMTFSNSSVEYGGQTWYLYDNNHLVSKDSVDKGLAVYNVDPHQNSA